MITITYLDIILRLLAALLFGGLVGIERVMAHKKAGVRTYALVSMGSALFMIISVILTDAYVDIASVDPTRLASQIVVGVGFLGGGLIILNGTHLHGLTTAAGLWVVAGIGMAAGFGLYLLGFIAAVLTLFIFTILWYFEKMVKSIFPTSLDDDN